MPCVRLGEAIDRTLVNHLLKMFTALGIYTESFEKPFLECTSEFYAAEGVKYMQQSDVPDYLKHVEVLNCDIFSLLEVTASFFLFYIFLKCYLLPSNHGRR